MKQFIVIIALFALSLFGPAGAWAQATPSPTGAEEQSEAVLQKQRLDAELEALTQIYRGQLTEYRAAEKEFQIAQDQYRELQTLASINDVTEAAREVMKFRGQVLLTYFELIRVRLIAAEGVELSLKEGILPKLEEQKNWLQNHQQQIAAATDREEFNQLSDVFIEKVPVFQAISHEGVSLLTVGKLQNVFDRLASLGDDITAQEASNSAVAQSRAMRETARTTQEVRSSFQTLWAELRKSIQDNDGNSFYNNMTKSLNPVYANLNKLASFIDELLRTL